jgi:serine/threonine-protein kinase BUR1
MKQELINIVNKDDESTGEGGSTYMVFPYMDHDLERLVNNPSIKFTPAMIKAYMKQILNAVDYIHKVSSIQHILFSF